jgi:hypothetical protein
MGHVDNGGHQRRIVAVGADLADEPISAPNALVSATRSMR